MFMDYGKKGTKCVEIVGVDDKRQVTAVFACLLSRHFLPVQMIYKGTTPKCFPKYVAFLTDWHITCTANHWSNEDKMVDYVKQIIVPYITKKREQLGLNSNHCALTMFDVFKGQCTDSIYFQVA